MAGSLCCEPEISQHCQLAVLQYKIKSLKFTKKERDLKRMSIHSNCSKIFLLNK